MVEKYEVKIINLEESIRRYKIFAFSIMAVSGLSIFFFWYLLFNAKGTEYEYLRDLGSISGGIASSLFSLSGLILVYVAFLGQKQQLLNQQIELYHNKEELKLNRLELQNQQKEMQQQNETLKLQNFESTYFNLIDNYQKNISLNYIKEKSNWFTNFVRNYKSSIETLEKVPGINVQSESVLRVRYNYPSLSDFSFVYQISSIVSIIDNSNIKNRQYYLKTLWGLLSLNEKECIYIIVNFHEHLEPEVKEIFMKSEISDYFKYYQ